jgi:CBS domain-containing protein
MKVEQLMTKEVACCRPDDSLDDAARIMWERDCGFVPVTEGEGRHVVGVVTDRDLCMAAYFRGASLKAIPVREVMSTGVRSCRPGDEVSEAEATMRAAQVHRLPVVDDADQLLGLLSLADLAREAAREAGSRRREVTEAEIGGTLAAIRRARQLAAGAGPRPS